MGETRTRTLPDGTRVNVTFEGGWHVVKRSTGKRVRGPYGSSADAQRIANEMNDAHPGKARPYGMRKVK